MNNPFSGEWGMPGTRVMEGMSAAAQANTAYQQSMQQFLNTQQQRANVPVLEQQRQLLLGRQATDIELNKMEDAALLSIAKGNYSTEQDYLKTLNQVSPVAPGYSRVLETGSDGKKSILMRDPAGNIVGTEPAYKGKSAQDNLLLNAGRNVRARAQALPAENQAEANLAAQLAINENATNNSLQKQMFELERQLLLGGAGGTRGGKGSGKGGAGTASQGFSLEGADLDRLNEIAMQNVAGSEEGVYYDSTKGVFVDSTTGAPLTAAKQVELRNKGNQLGVMMANQYYSTGDMASLYNGIGLFNQQTAQQAQAARMAPYNVTTPRSNVRLNVSGSSVPAATPGMPMYLPAQPSNTNVWQGNRPQVFLPR